VKNTKPEPLKALTSTVLQRRSFGFGNKDDETWQAVCSSTAGWMRRPDVRQIEQA